MQGSCGKRGAKCGVGSIEVSYVVSIIYSDAKLRY